MLDSFSSYASMIKIFFPYRWVMLGVLLAGVIMMVTSIGVFGILF